MGGVTVYLRTFLTSAVDGVEWLASRPRPLYHGLRAPGTHWTEGWVGLGESTDTVAKRKKILLLPMRELNPGRPARSRVSILIGLLR